MPTRSPYSGAWLRASYSDPKGKVVHQAAGADHGENEPGPGAGAHQAPPLQEVGPIGEYPGSEWVARTMGVLFDRTPDDHDASGNHGEDLGAVAAGVSAPLTPVIAAGESYTTTRFGGQTGITVDPVALQRGLNSEPVNNPEGYTPGHHESHWVERKFYLGERVHDARIVRPNLAYERQIPAPPQPSAIGTPFASNARAILNVFQRPENRRAPEPVDNDVFEDPAPNYADQAGVIGAWVVG